jgi:signal transduction histidine kinase
MEAALKRYAPESDLASYREWREGRILSRLRTMLAVVALVILIWMPLDYLARPAATFHNLIILYGSVLSLCLAGIWLSYSGLARRAALVVAFASLTILAAHFELYFTTLPTEPELMAIASAGAILFVAIVIPWGALVQVIFSALASSMFAIAVLLTHGFLGLPRMLPIMVGTVAIDAIACYAAWVLDHVRASLFARNAELEAANAKLEAVSRYRSALLAALSHDLRSPLHVQIGYLDLLNDGDLGALNSGQANAVRRALSSSRQQMKLVADLLDISRIDAGKLEVQVEDVELAPILEDVAAAGRDLLEGRPIEIATEVRVARAKADPARLRQVLQNLVNNAAKFTQSGKILLNSARRGDRVVLTVADTGAGIPAERMSKLFEPFGPHQHQPRDEGSGLGLAIARQLADAMGAALNVASEQGRGTTVEIVLPASDSPVGEQRPASIRPRQSAGHPAASTGRAAKIA